MLNRIALYIEKNELLKKNDTVIVGLSGGADSICMTHILCRLGYQVIAAHCNFSLRGSESDRDQAFVEEYCQKNSIELHTTLFNTPHTLLSINWVLKRPHVNCATAGLRS